MNRPDAISRAYAAIFPQLKQLGYRPNMKANSEYESARFYITVSRNPTTQVSPNGDWQREDGYYGNTPLELETLYMAEHYREMLKHQENEDLKGIAADILLNEGIILGAVLTANKKRNSLEVEYRPKTGCPETITIRSMKQAHERAITHITNQLNENMQSGDMSEYQRHVIRRIMLVK